MRVRNERPVRGRVFRLHIHIPEGARRGRRNGTRKARVSAPSKRPGGRGRRAFSPRARTKCRCIRAKGRCAASSRPLPCRTRSALNLPPPAAAAEGGEGGGGGLHIASLAWITGRSRGTARAHSTPHAAALQAARACFPAGAVSDSGRGGLGNAGAERGRSAPLLEERAVEHLVPPRAGVPAKRPSLRRDRLDQPWQPHRPAPPAPAPADSSRAPILLILRRGFYSDTAK